MVGATSLHSLEKRQTGRQGKETNCLNLILASTLSLSSLTFFSSHRFPLTNSLLITVLQIRAVYHCWALNTIIPARLSTF